ncbi:4'-phosphopantetheinyl transferase family protein [Microbulbifer sp. TRSA001]|uniref:4'-phosphopantetheinyl transferase family protein n=1 Tax=Microbulbifer sp. TRSA001 TaxID=3243381 RepID=UPI00403A1471
MPYFTYSSFNSWSGNWQGESVHLLGSTELSRLEKIHSIKRRAQFLAGRILLRTLIAEQYEYSPWEITVEAEAPTIAMVRGKPLCHISISHSDDFVAVAIAETPVGIDCEYESRQRNWLAMAKQYFHKAEITELNSLPTSQVAACFLTKWTAKEALAKCSGVDLGQLLASAPVINRPQQLNHPYKNYLLWTGQPRPGAYLSLAVKHNQATSVVNPIGTFRASHCGRTSDSTILKPINGFS